MADRRLAALLLAISIGLSGCWDRVEVNDLAVVTLVGVDRAEEGVRLTVNVMAPRQSAAGGAGTAGPARGISYVVYSSTGTTVMDAVRRMQSVVPRRLFWGHTRVLVLGRPYALEGIRPALDFWIRHREPRLRMHIVTADGEAEELLRTRPKLEQLLAEAVRETINLRGFARPRLRDLIIDLRAGVHPVMPMARLAPGPTDLPDVQVSDVALFRGDKMIGTLSNADAAGLEWILGEIPRSVVSLELPGGKVSFELLRARSAIIPYRDQGRLQVKIKATAEAKLLENTTRLDLAKEEVLRTVRRTMETQLAEQIARVVRRAQKEFRTDFLQVSDAVHRSMPALWEQRLKSEWERQFPETPITVTVSVPIRETGATTKSQVRP